jgi:hypothetical protein
MEPANNEKTTRTHGFIEGQSGNPSGRPKLDPDVLEARKMLKNDICRSVIKIRSMTLVDAKTLYDGPDKGNLTLGEYAILKSYVKGDVRGIDYFESRILGKVEQNVQLGGGENPLRIVYADKDDENL